MEATDLRSLIRLKCGTIRKFASLIKVSENTVQNHLKDGNWDMNQMVRICKVLDIPNRFVFLYFFEPVLAQTKVQDDHETA